MKRSLLQFTRFLILLVLVFGFREMQAQTNGCTLGNFGIDAGLYSGTNENPPPAVTNTTMDWFQGSAGHGIIDETSPATLTSLLQGSGDPTYLRRLKYPKLSTVNSQIMIDAVFARDNFGGTGFIDATSFNTASKNGEDPAIWDPGPQNVLGKNDLIDVAGTMYRDGPLLTNDLYFDGVITRAEPGGDAYMDFEFFIEAITYNPSTGFSSGGPQMGHTAFTFDPTTHAVTKVGDFIYNLSLSGGTVPALEVRLWVSHTDYLSGNHPPGFTWGPNYDGAFTGSPYGYASIIPVAPELCGIVNTPGRTSAAPPWGVKSTKYNSWNTSYSDYSFIELGLNMTHFGIDHASLSGADPCYFPIHTFVVKTRASSSFTAQLKDFAGPYSWGQFSAVAEIVGDTVLSCSHPLVTLIADPVRTDVTYSWTTLDGQIIGSADQSSITTTTPGTYTLQETLIGTLCSTPPHNAIVGWNYTRPPFGTQLSSTTVSCNGTNGSINLTPVGGAPPYTYLWSGPNSFSSTVEDPTGLVPGTYYVTITDAGACTISTAAVVNAATPIVITPGATSTNCYGGTNGTASVAVTGHSPFTYYWSNGNITPSISNLIAGTYTVTVTDADGCTQVSS
ncbi:MAG: SprB repeat-containing protein [Bacteroidota bacterium]